MRCVTDPGPALLARARGAIACHLALAAPIAPDHPALAQRGASFVTLTQDGRLRGCIGSIRAQRSLGDDVAYNAVAAASRDPRFAPLAREEYDAIRIEISLLSEAHLIDDTGEQAFHEHVRPGLDGVILHAGCRSATYLPQVWEVLPEPARFLAELKRKAGLPAHHDGDTLMFATFTVRNWSE